MKIDLRIICKRMVSIFLIFGFFNVRDSVNNQKLSQSIDGKLSLDQIYALSQIRQPGLATRTQSIIPAQKTTDLYTQSQAHMSVPEVKKLIAATYDLKPYQKFIDAIFYREKEYADYYVFYHGTDNVWRVPQDLYTRFYMHFKNISSERMKDFIFLRFNGLHDFASIDNFLIAKIKQEGLINDHTMSNDILAVNFALFGNVGTPPECTWQYFLQSRGHAKPTRATYERIMDIFGLPYTYINELMALVNSYKTKEETILQIFVPKNLVNKIGYLAWIRGIPADQNIMHTVERSVKDKQFAKTAPALDYYTQLLKQEQEKNILFKNLLDRLKIGEFSLNYFLAFYRNHPAQIEDINSYQARLFLTHDVILNPLSGVKIFRYSTATADQLLNYQLKFDAIFNKIITGR